MQRCKYTDPWMETEALRSFIYSFYTGNCIRLRIITTPTYYREEFASRLGVDGCCSCSWLAASSILGAGRDAGLLVISSDTLDWNDNRWRRLGAGLWLTWVWRRKWRRLLTVQSSQRSQLGDLQSFFSAALLYIFIHQIMVAWMKKIYIRRKISNKNTEAELNNMQTPRLFAWHRPVYNRY